MLSSSALNVQDKCQISSKHLYNFR